MLKRIANRLRRDARTTRLKLGIRLLEASNFEYWGRLSDATHGEKLDEPLQDTWLGRGEKQFEHLRKMGLAPHHRFLDYGCAYLATARHVIPYLEPGNYVGTDVARRAMQRGVKRLSQLGIERKRYHVLNATGPDLGELEGFQFDVIYSFSVLQYLSPDDFVGVTGRFKEMLSADGICVLTYASQGNVAELASKGMNYHDIQALNREFPSDAFEVAMGEVSEGFARVALIRRKGRGRAWQLA